MGWVATLVLLHFVNLTLIWMIYSALLMSALSVWLPFICQWLRQLVTCNQDCLAQLKSDIAEFEFLIFWKRRIYIISKWFLSTFLLSLFRGYLSSKYDMKHSKFSIHCSHFLHDICFFWAAESNLKTVSATWQFGKYAELTPHLCCLMFSNKSLALWKRMFLLIRWLIH
jgi:hypothetical protein